MKLPTKHQISTLAILVSVCVLCSIVAPIFGDFFVDLAVGDGSRRHAIDLDFIRLLGTAFGFSFLSSLTVCCILIPAELFGLTRLLEKGAPRTAADRASSRVIFLFVLMVLALVCASTMILAMKTIASAAARETAIPAITFGQLVAQPGLYDGTELKVRGCLRTSEFDVIQLTECDPAGVEKAALFIDVVGMGDEASTIDPSKSVCVPGLFREYTRDFIGIGHLGSSVGLIEHAQSNSASP